MKIYMFRAVLLSIIKSLFTVHSAMVYVIQDCRQLSSRTRMVLPETDYKPVWHIPLLSVQWINSWWWTEELPETCRFSWQNKFVKLVHLFGFITKKFVTKPVWHIPLLSVQWINSWWWTEELPETCRFSWQNKFVKLVHLVGFITRKPGKGQLSWYRKRKLAGKQCNRDLIPHMEQDTSLPHRVQTISGTHKLSHLVE